MNINDLPNIEAVKYTGRGITSKIGAIEVIGYKDGDKNNSNFKEGKISDIVSQFKNNNVKNIQNSTIFDCARGYRSRARHYYWEFKNQTDKRKYNIFYSNDAQNELLSKNDANKKIICYDVNGKAIQIFNDVFSVLFYFKEKNSQTNKFPDYKSILNICNNHNKDNFKVKTAFGFQWRFLDEITENNN